jgi:PAS domain S-box-containing protein
MSGPRPVAAPGAPTLRQQAEAALQGRPVPSAAELAALPPEQARVMLHELRVHQIELEMQNEELRRAQEELEDVRARYFDLFDLAPVGYVTLGDSGQILEANLTVAALLGVARGALLQQPFGRFIAQADQDLYYLLRKRLGATPTAEVAACELRVVKDNGVPCWVQLAASAAEDAEGAPVCRVVVSDITARKQAEAARDRLAEQVEGKNRELGNLLRAISQDLRSPLLHIQGYSRRIESDCHELGRLTTAEVPSAADRAELAALLTNRLPQSLAAILAGVEKMDRLVGGMQQLRSLGRVSMQPGPVDMEEMIRKIARTLTVLQPVNGSSIEVEALPSCGGDPDQLNQLFTHLIDNALKFRDPSRPLRVVVSGRVDREQVIYCVADTGLGIGPEHQGRIWELFYQVAHRGPAGGEGVGLSLAQRIVERHGGSIRVESTPGEGSRFVVTLPLAV